MYKNGCNSEKVNWDTFVKSADLKLKVCTGLNPLWWFTLQKSLFSYIKPSAAYRLEIMLQMKREEAELEADGKMDY